MRKDVINGVTYVTINHREIPPITEWSEPKFKVGDKVIYTNDYGVCWGEKEIIEVVFESWDKAPRYHYKNSKTPWFPVSEKNLRKAD